MRQLGIPPLLRRATARSLIIHPLYQATMINHQPDVALSTVLTPAPALVVFDSGIGGINALCQLLLRLNCNGQPTTPLSTLYLADTARFPYSKLTPTQMTARAHELTHFVDQHLPTPPRLCMYACHSLSTHLNLDQLNPSITHLPVIPAIDILDTKSKPAPSSSAQILVMCTPTTATALRPLAHNLTTPTPDYSLSPTVVVYGTTELAAICEDIFFHGHAAPATLTRFEQEFSQVLARQPNITQLLLSCTHYIYAKPELEKILSRLNSRITISDSTELILDHHQTAIRLAFKPTYSTSPAHPQHQIIVMSDYDSDQQTMIKSFIQAHLPLTTCQFKFIPLKPWLP